MTDDRAQMAGLTSSALNPFLRHLIFWPVFVGGVAIDLWSKYAVFNYLIGLGKDSITLIDGFLNFHLTQNAGAAFGLAYGQRWMLIAVSAVALVVVITIFLFSGIDRKIIQLALALFAAGVSGNLYDRIFNDGLVRDFIDVVYWPGKHWPSFNAADSMLCIAVGLLILSGLFTPGSCQKPAQPQK